MFRFIVPALLLPEADGAHAAAIHAGALKTNAEIAMDAGALPDDLSGPEGHHARPQARPRAGREPGFN